MTEKLNEFDLTNLASKGANMMSQGLGNMVSQGANRVMSGFGSGKAQGRYNNRFVTNDLYKKWRVYLGSQPQMKGTGADLTGYLKLYYPKYSATLTKNFQQLRPGRRVAPQPNQPAQPTVLSRPQVDAVFVSLAAMMIQSGDAYFDDPKKVGAQQQPRRPPQQQQQQPQQKPASVQQKRQMTITKTQLDRAIAKVGLQPTQMDIQEVDAVFQANPKPTIAQIMAGVPNMSTATAMALQSMMGP